MKKVINLYFGLNWKMGWGLQVMKVLEMYLSAINIRVSIIFNPRKEITGILTAFPKVF